jgi:WD40 repeat protein
LLEWQGNSPPTAARKILFVGIWGHCPQIPTKSFWLIGGDSIVYDPTGTIIATGGFDGMINAWDVENGQRIYQIAMTTGGLSRVAISPDGHYLIVGECDGQLKQWNLTSGLLIRELEGHQDYINRITFSPNGRLFATTGDDNRVRIWDGETGDLLLSIPQHAPPFGVEFSPDGRRIAVTYVSGDLPRDHIRLFDVTSGEEIQRMKSVERNSYDVHFTSDGQHLVAGTEQVGKIFVWDSYTGEEVDSFETGRSISSTCLLSDDRQIVLGTTDGTVEVWDLESGERLRTLMQAKNERQLVTVSPDERHVAAVNYTNGLVRILTLDLDELIAIGESRLTRGLTASECVTYRIEDCSADP